MCLALFCSIWFLSALSVPDDQCMSFKNIKCENECRTRPFLLRTVTLAGLKWIDTNQHGSVCCSAPCSLSSIFRSSPSIHHCQILRLTPSAHVMAAYKAWTCLKVCECAHAPTHMCPCDDVFGAGPWSRTWQKSSCCVQFVLWLSPVRQQFITAFNTTSDLHFTAQMCWFQPHQRSSSYTGTKSRRLQHTKVWP